jgi:hypothetical protein
VSGDGTGATQSQMEAGVAAALAAAEIPPSKLGPARHARLTDIERELYDWILRRFATAVRPTSADVRAVTERLGLDGNDAFATLAREDLVHRGADGEITVAYPFSGRPTAHHVRFPGGHEVDAMCAIDALGIAPMFGEPIAIESRDPASGNEIRAGRARRGRRVAARVGGCRRRRDTPRARRRLLRLLPGAELLRHRRQRRALAGRASRGSRPRHLDGRGGRRRAGRLRGRAHRELMPTPVDRQQVQRLLAEEQAQLVEVLPPAEYEDEHLPGAINIPLKELDRETTARLHRSRPVIAYCYDYQ